MRRKGRVKTYNNPRGFGYIQETTEHRPSEYFFHISDVEDRQVLDVGDLVTFSVGPSPKRPGATQAVNVVPVTEVAG